MNKIMAMTQQNMSSSDIKLLLFREIDKLPEHFLWEAKQKIETLLEKSNRENNSNVSMKSTFLGSMPNLVKFIADDFNAPLEDFKEYM